MLMQSRLIASGQGWQAEDIVCSAGPHDRPFEEAHEGVCIAVVRSGTFQYRAPQGAAVLAPGSILLGNHGTCYRCGHDHSTGDRCLSFHFAQQLFEEIASGVPGVRRAAFAAPSLPPLRELARLIAELDVAAADGENSVLEELALRLAGAVTALLRGDPLPPPDTSRRDERRISDVLRYIEANAQERVTLADLAGTTGMSRFHFLRTFRRIIGMSPHQFVLRMRLHQAAVRICRSNEPISAIAFDSGFDDLSTFNRRFRRVMGLTPGEFRAARRPGQ
jgi:AraC family transcriptional regulator